MSEKAAMLAGQLLLSEARYLPAGQSDSLVVSFDFHGRLFRSIGHQTDLG